MTEVKVINKTGTAIRFNVSEQTRSKDIAPDEYGILDVKGDSKLIIVEIF